MNYLQLVIFFGGCCFAFGQNKTQTRLFSAGYSGSVGAGGQQGILNGILNPALNPGLLNQGFQQPGLVNNGYGQSGLVNTGFGQPGLVNTGFGQPGLVNSGFGQPGLVNTGFGQPGLGNNGFVQPGYQGLVNSGLQQPGLVNTGLSQGLLASGTGSKCRYWCKTPEGQAYCCESGDEIPTAVVGTKLGYCPQVRPTCPRISGQPPLPCSNDYKCGDLDKCCYDRCLEQHVCKPQSLW